MVLLHTRMYIFRKEKRKIVKKTFKLAIKKDTKINNFIFSVHDRLGRQ